MDKLVQNTMKVAAICNSSEEEAEECDVIEDTPTNSPLNYKRSSIVYETGEQSIEAPPFSPLTPKPKGQSNSNRLRDKVYEIGEQSIEAPPYSPLTPKPIAQADPNRLRDKDSFIHDLGKKDINESFPSSPLLYLEKKPVRTYSRRKRPSPCRSMSPGLLDLVQDEKIFGGDSDDSVKDPDYEADDDDDSDRTDCEDDDCEDTFVIIPFLEKKNVTSNEPKQCSNEPAFVNISTNNKRPMIVIPRQVDSLTDIVTKKLLLQCNKNKVYKINASHKENNPVQSSNEREKDIEIDDSSQISRESSENRENLIETDTTQNKNNNNLQSENPENNSSHNEAEEKKGRPNSIQRDIEIDESAQISGEGSENRENLIETDTAQNIDNNNLQSENPENNNSDDEAEGKKGRRKKGRKRKFHNTKAEAKKLKYSNLPFFNRKNQLVEPKTFTDYRCTCKKNCGDIVSREEREREFNKFVNLGSYAAQSIYIISNVKETNKKRAITQPKDPQKQREYYRIYTLAGVKVCKDMFINTLKISPQKITVCLKKNRNEEIIQDKRGGVVAGWNKATEEEINFAKEFIKRVPKYVSHYRRNATESEFLSPGTTLVSLYTDYTTEFNSQPDVQSRKLLSLSAFKKIFYDNFNLKFKTLKKDTCNKCDKFAIAKESTEDPSEKEFATDKHNEHMQLAEKSREQMNKDFEKAKTDTTTETITFDLEKTLPLPRIPTNIAFYKRQLWLYNSGIHVGSNDTGYCYVWVEGEAGRGAQEVGSCLIKHIKDELRPGVEHLITWSDSCGGQNRNIKIVLMLKTVLHSHPTLKTIQCRYLEPGHSFLPNDTDFSKIELRLKQHERVYTPEDYISIMKSCKKKNPLRVVRMQSNMFLGTETLEKNITNRKVCQNKNKINWLTTKEILLKKEDTHLIYMRKDFEEDYQILNILQKKRGRPMQDNIQEAQLTPLWPQDKEIAEAKLNDLKSMFKFIPADALPFYQKLRGSRQAEDDVDGFGGTPDFEQFFSDEE